MQISAECGVRSAETWRPAKTSAECGVRSAETWRSICAWEWACLLRPRTGALRGWAIATLGMIALLTSCPTWGAGNVITATIAVTNAAGTTNGQTVTVNGTTRTWTNNVQVPGSQIFTNATAAGAATNMFVQFVDYPFAGNLSYALPASNSVSVAGAPGAAVTVTVSAGWATVTYGTNYLTNAIVVRVPLSVEVGAQQTNIASMLASALESSTNSFSATDVAHSNYVSTTQAQTVSGNKYFTGGSNYVAGAYLNGPTSTNLVNYGNALSSPGGAGSAEQFGIGAQATAGASLAVGANSLASASSAVAAGQTSTASGVGSTAIGSLASAVNKNDTALGTAASAAGTNSTALGYGATVGAGYTNSTAVGYQAHATAANQIMLGSAGISAVVNNVLTVGAGATFGQGVTNLWATGTNTFLAGSDVAFVRYPLTTLANGNNAGVAVGTNVFVEVSGPTGAFTVNGLNGGPNRDGKVLILLNRTGQNMTLANDSGVEPTAGNRIYCLTGADKTVTGNSAALLIYNANVTHWVVLSFTQ